MSSQLKVFQPCATVALLAIGVLGGWFPYMFRRKQNFDRIVSYINCFSAGILIGVAFLHVFDESGSNLNSAAKHYPLNYCITFVATMLMVMFITLGHSHSHAPAQHDDPERDKMVGQVCNNCGADAVDSVESAKEKQAPGHAGKNWTTLIALMSGLMIHDVSEGLALGFISELQHAVYFFLGIMLHKWSDLSCQVICGIKQGVTAKQNILMIVPLVLATPLAQVVAFAITLKQGQANAAMKITEDVFMSLACGSFLAIAFVEIIGEELHARARKETLLKCMTITLGFALIAATKVIEVVTGSHDHEHDHDHAH